MCEMIRVVFIKNFSLSFTFDNVSKRGRKKKIGILIWIKDDIRHF